MIRFLAGAFFDLLLPPSCAICNQLLDDAKSTVCTECRFAFDEIVPPLCSFCGQPLESGMGEFCPVCRLHRPVVQKTRSAFIFGGGLQQAILAMKLSRRSELAQYLADEAVKIDITDWSWEKIQLLVPVPLHKKRLQTRMFDQASMIALRLGRSIGLRTATSILKRQKDTFAQARQPNRNTRRKNIKGAFKVVRPKLVKGKSICLIDDVVTTGATLDECAGVLLNAGAKSVTAFTVARTPRW